MMKNMLHRPHLVSEKGKKKKKVHNDKEILNNIAIMANKPARSIFKSYAFNVSVHNLVKHKSSFSEFSDKT
jgi:hypothetical protein